jgi:hypothetical protein
VFELGEGAAESTWEECCDTVRNIDDESVTSFLTEVATHFEALRNHFTDYGAWTREEVESWTLFDLAALCLQEFVHDYRQFCDYCGSSWGRYREESESGKVSGRLYRGESGERLLYFGI